MLNIRLATVSTSIFTTLSYLLCVAFGLLAPERIHMHHLLELLLPSFTWIDLGSFFLGLVESVLWGVYLGGGFAMVYNMVFRLSPPRDAR